MAYGLLQRWRPSTRTAVVRAPADPRRGFGLGDIARGWIVRDSDGRRIGTIARAGEERLTIARGFFARPLDIPVSFVAEVGALDLRLNRTLAWLEALGPRRGR